MSKGNWSVQVRCINPECNAFIRYKGITMPSERNPREECAKCRDARQLSEARTAREQQGRKLAIEVIKPAVRGTDRLRGIITDEDY